MFGWVGRVSSKRSLHLFFFGFSIRNKTQNVNKTNKIFILFFLWCNLQTKQLFCISISLTCNFFKNLRSIKRHFTNRQRTSNVLSRLDISQYCFAKVLFRTGYECHFLIRAVFGTAPKSLVYIVPVSSPFLNCLSTLINT